MACPTGVERLSKSFKRLRTAILLFSLLLLATIIGSFFLSIEVVVLGLVLLNVINILVLSLLASVLQESICVLAKSDVALLKIIKKEIMEKEGSGNEASK